MALAAVLKDLITFKLQKIDPANAAKFPIECNPQFGPEKWHKIWIKSIELASWVAFQ